MDKEYEDMIREQREDSDRWYFTAKLWLIAISLAFAVYHIVTTLC